MVAVPWKWMAKTVVQKAVSLAPASDALNHRLQSLLGRDEITVRGVTNRAEMVRHHLHAFDRAGLGSPVDGIRPGITVLEVGTGWNPAVPLLLWLCGADRVISVDHVDHSSDANLTRTAALLADMLADGSLPAELECLVAARTEELAALVRCGAAPAELAAAAGFQRRVADVVDLRLDVPVDAVVSNLVLEHIGAAALPSILRGTFGLVRPGGVMSHCIDPCDHGHYVDPRLSQFNYLRFSSRAWKLVGNDVQFENRLRASQYLELFERAGIPVDDVSTRAGEWAQLAAVPLAEEFRHLDADDLLVVFLHVTSLKHP